MAVKYQPWSYRSGSKKLAKKAQKKLNKQRKKMSKGRKGGGGLGDDEEVGIRCRSQADCSYYSDDLYCDLSEVVRPV